MKRATDYELMLAGLRESFEGSKRYSAKGPNDRYYVDNPRAAQNAGFIVNFSEIGHYAADGELVADWCIRDIDRLVDGQRDAQNDIPEDLHMEIRQSLEQAKAKFKELHGIMDRAAAAWEKMVDEHL